MSDLRSMDRKFVTEFIELYKENVCLWNVKSKNYANKRVRNAAYNVLLDKLREIQPDASKETVLRRINSIRSCFRKEQRKVRASENTTYEGDEVYTPSLWYYSLLSDFLKDQDLPFFSSLNSHSEKNGEDVTDIQDNDEDFIPPPIVHMESFSPPKKKLKKTKTVGDKTDAVLDLVVQSLQQQEDGPLEIFGKYVSSQLSELDDNMIIFAQKLINQTLYEAKMGNLETTSQIMHSSDGVSGQINPSSVKVMSALSSLQNSEYSCDNNTLGYDSENSIDEERLILKVKQFPIIYEKHRNYRDNSLREKRWQDISMQLNCSVNTCQIKWEALEKIFWKSHQLVISAPNRTKLKLWKWYNAMSYLLSNDEDRLETDADKQYTSISNSKTFPSSSEERVQRGHNSGAENQSSLSFANEDEAFFISLLPTVRKFDNDDKIDFRGDVLDSVRKIKRSKKSSPPQPRSTHSYNSRNDEQVFVPRRSISQSDQLINNLQDDNYVNIKEEQGIYVDDV